MPAKDITNMKFGKLTAISIAYRKNYIAYWKCKCECGKEKIVALHSLTTGKTKSCGCNHKKANQKFKKFNDYEIKGDTVELRTNNSNKIFYVDLEDFPKIKNYCWGEMNNGYIVHKNGKEKTLLLHRYVTNCPKGKVVDHIDHNPLNNCKANLRICSQKENTQNRKIVNTNKLKCFGVSYIKQGERMYYIVNLGGYKKCFKNFDDAVKLRDKILKEREILLTKENFLGGNENE